jgi:hypothetical protein
MQSSCLAKPEERNPSRYLISLKLNAFSNMPETSSIGKQQEKFKTPFPSPENLLSSPCDSSSQPQANLQKSLTSSQNPSTSSQNPLPLQNSALWTHNPKPALSPLPHCPTFPTAVNMENSIESNLKNLSLFQKPVKLFTANQLTPTNITTSSTYSIPNQIVTVELGPTFSEFHKSTDADPLNSMATNYQNRPPAPSKTTHSSNKHPRKSPYNTRSPKKTLTTSLDKPAHSTANETTETFTPPHSSSSQPKLLEMKKRLNTLEVAPPSKKGPGVLVELIEPPDIAPANTLVFNPGLYEKIPAKSLFKATRKGKNKLISAVIETEATSRRNWGFAKPPQ